MMAIIALISDFIFLFITTIGAVFSVAAQFFSLALFQLFDFFSSIIARPTAVVGYIFK